MTGTGNALHLVWASDFPRSDSTWPWSQRVLKEHTVYLSQEAKEPARSRQRVGTLRVTDEERTVGQEHVDNGF